MAEQYSTCSEYMYKQFSSSTSLTSVVRGEWGWEGKVRDRSAGLQKWKGNQP
jgi:hypothetical protein